MVRKMFNFLTKSKTKSPEEKELYFMYKNEPMKLEIGLVKLQGLTKYEEDMKVLDIRIKYENITPYDLELSRLKVNYQHGRISTEIQHKKLMLDIHLKYSKITQRDYDMAQLEFIEDKHEKDLAVLEVLLKYKEITEDEFDKEVSTLNGVPWFKFSAKLADDHEQMVMGMDYNELFIQKLVNDGHPGQDEDEIIDFFIKDFGRKLHADSDEIPDEVMQAEDIQYLEKQAYLPDEQE